MNTNNDDELRRFKEAPEGSVDKQFYDFQTQSFADYLAKYYNNSIILRGWDEWLQEFVYPAFNKSKWYDYQAYLNKIKPPFAPDYEKLHEFWEEIKNDPRFDDELKYFFSFLYSCGFFKNVDFESWLRMKEWKHPWRKNAPEDTKTIQEILTFRYGINYLKVLLLSMPWMSRR